MKIREGEILLRDAVAADAPLLMSWWNDGAVMAHAGFPDGLGLSLEATVRNIRAFDGHQGKLFIIEIKGTPVGEANYRINNGSVAECGWKICEAAWQNKGYGTRLIRMLLGALFGEAGTPSGVMIQKVIWDTNLLNARAQRVYEHKVGARKVAVRQNSFQNARGIWQSSVHYEMGREEFFSKTS